MKGSSVFINFIWKFLERGGCQIVNLAIAIILARLLEPKDYGLVAMTLVFTTILNIFLDSGFGNALIQKKDADDKDFSTVFYFNIMFGLLLYSILFLSSPFISSFYEISELTPVLRVIGFTTIIMSVKNVQQAYIARNMMFRKMFVASMVGVVFSAIVGVYLAYNGYGVWALVYQTISNQFMATLVLWLIVGWRPKLCFSFDRLKSLFTFGSRLLLSDLIYNGYTELRQLLIGKYYSSIDLAFYNQGNKFPQVLGTNINESINSVLFPAMSNVQDDIVTLRNMLRKSIIISQFVVAPLVLGLAACAEPLVVILLTEKWLPCVPYLQLFCLCYVYGAMGNANQNAIIAVGRSDIKLKVEFFKTSIDVLVLLLTVWISPMAIALGVVACSIIRIGICAWPNKELLGYSFMEQIKDILPNIIISFVMFVIVYAVNLLHFNSWLTILIQVPLGLSVYLLLAYVTHSMPLFYILEIIKKKRSRLNDTI